ncbi:hypothetical protein SUGI_0491550 [Cryptomeria japonica]|nr:hypothetical protein SUGI_0491550 [Cryptomeria japonica]
MKSREELRFIPQRGDDKSPLLSENDLSTGSIQLSILKLDSTSFNVRVSTRASVHELKNAVQTEFGVSQNEEQGKIPWGIVWGNFCLTYQSHKLVDDSILLSSFGIKDSDQLCFVRHNSPVKEGDKLSPRKHVKLPPFRKKSSDRPKVTRTRLEASASKTMISVPGTEHRLHLNLQI